ncbi:hypothetical protein X275_05255 [Marinitoga sp. 1197]|uniref:hypothetical protein n=1 Tax=Marinitoga sp. 1197 TaxID=1428449 RepID=UPI0006410F4A|nr:hypothetical protein [Marinitoga sp. 1197]KLO22736.1 hypothetical protein X275_05255 [Marinitoga sp. 1197]
MATRIQVGGKRKSSNKWLIFLFIAIIALGLGGVFYFYNNLKNTTEIKADAVSYLITYEMPQKTELYFIRIKNQSRKIFIVKSPDNIYYSEKNLYIDSLKPEEALTNFEQMFDINPSTIKYHFVLKSGNISPFLSILKGQGNSIDDLFNFLKARKSGLFDMLIANNIVKEIRKYGNTNLSYNGAFALLQAFSKYSITSYNKLEIKTLLSKPVTINLPDLKKKMERNYIDKTSLESLKTILE